MVAIPFGYKILPKNIDVVPEGTKWYHADEHRWKDCMWIGSSFENIRSYTYNNVYICPGSNNVEITEDGQLIELEY